MPARPAAPPAEATHFDPLPEPTTQLDGRPMAFAASTGPAPATPAVGPATERAEARQAEAPPADARPTDARPAAAGHREPALEAPDLPTAAQSRDAGTPSREVARSPRRPSPASGQAGPPQPVAAERRPNLNGGELDDQGDRGATGPQLRRFIKSRAYVPMHELRRRFAINGHDDDVTAVDVEKRRIFVGLPDREGRLLAELLRGGDIGYELSMDPITPIVVGVYPMRPVTRP